MDNLEKVFFTIGIGLSVFALGYIAIQFISCQNEMYARRKLREVIATPLENINLAYWSLQKNEQLPENTTIKDFIAVMKFTRKDTSTAFQAKGNSEDGYPLQACSPDLPCLIFSNGSVLQYDPTQSLKDGYSMFFNLDPDGNGPLGRSTVYLNKNRMNIIIGDERTDNIKIQGKLTPQVDDPEYFSNYFSET